jgi:hypothetical protein
MAASTRAGTVESSTDLAVGGDKVIAMRTTSALRTTAVIPNTFAFPDWVVRRLKA